MLLLFDLSEKSISSVLVQLSPYQLIIDRITFGHFRVLYKHDDHAGVSPTTENGSNRMKVL